MIATDDRSFRFGDGLFETVRVEKSGPLALERHLERFNRSAHELGFPFQSVRDGVVALRELESAMPGVWRVTVSRDDPDAPFGGSGMVDSSRRPLPGNDRPSLMAIRGLWSPDVSLWEHKTTSWLRCAEARRRANQNGFDDALLVGGDGFVGEASSANIFVVIDDEIVTPPVRGILPGTARARLLAAAAGEGLPIVEREIHLSELERAAEIVLTNAARLAVSAASFDGRALDNDCGALFESWIRAQG